MIVEQRGHGDSEWAGRCCLPGRAINLPRGSERASRSQAAVQNARALLTVERDAHDAREVRRRLGQLNAHGEPRQLNQSGPIRQGRCVGKSGKRDSPLHQSTRGSLDGFGKRIGAARLLHRLHEWRQRPLSLVLAQRFIVLNPGQPKPLSLR